MDEYHDLYGTLAGIQADDHVREMKKYIQHGGVSTFEHCENVAKLSYKINKKLRLRSDLYTLLTGAMLHDFYLYDWHDSGDGTHKLHGFTHAKRAYLNAKKYLDIDEKIGHVIYCHMWPLNPARIPLSKEAWIVCIADKCISLYETFFRRNIKK